jgi:hypothetical protein
VPVQSRSQYEEATRRFLDLDAKHPALRQRLPHFPCETLKSVDLSFPMFNEMIVQELADFVNWMNSWQNYLDDLAHWQTVLDSYGTDEQARWAATYDLVKPMLFFCLFQPSAAKDRFIMIATNALHQLRYASETDYKDRLEQDQLKPGQWLRRKAAMDQLRRIAMRWPQSKPFLDTVTEMDGAVFRQQTLGYRNAASHAIPPNIELGETQMVTRGMAARSEVIARADGTLEYRIDDTKKCVSYGFGGTPPLMVKDAFQACASEYEKARTCFWHYVALLEDVAATLPKRSQHEQSRTGSKSA